VQAHIANPPQSHNIEFKTRADRNSRLEALRRYQSPHLHAANPGPMEHTSARIPSELGLVQKRLFPLKSNKDAVLAGCRFLGRAPIHKFRCKTLDNSNIYREKVRVNPEFSIFPHIKALQLASASPRRLDHRRILFISIFKNCWIFLSEIWKSEGSGDSCQNRYRKGRHRTSGMGELKGDYSDYISLLDVSFERKPGYRSTYIENIRVDMVRPKCVCQNAEGLGEAPP